MLIKCFYFYFSALGFLITLPLKASSKVYFYSQIHITSDVDKGPPEVLTRIHQSQFEIAKAIEDQIRKQPERKIYLFDEAFSFNEAGGDLESFMNILKGYIAHQGLSIVDVLGIEDLPTNKDEFLALSEEARKNLLLYSLAEYEDGKLCPLDDLNAALEEGDIWGCKDARGLFLYGIYHNAGAFSWSAELTFPNFFGKNFLPTSFDSLTQEQKEFFGLFGAGPYLVYKFPHLVIPMPTEDRSQVRFRDRLESEENRLKEAIRNAGEEADHDLEEAFDIAARTKLQFLHYNREEKVAELIFNCISSHKGSFDIALIYGASHQFDWLFEKSSIDFERIDTPSTLDTLAWLKDIRKAWGTKMDQDLPRIAIPSPRALMLQKSQLRKWIRRNANLKHLGFGVLPLFDNL